MINKAEIKTALYSVINNGQDKVVKFNLGIALGQIQSPYTSKAGAIAYIAKHGYGPSRLSPEVYAAARKAGMIEVTRYVSQGRPCESFNLTPKAFA